MHLLQLWLTTQADRRPEATAVVDGCQRLTYGQLEVSSNRLARVLRARGCLRGDRVCLLMPKSTTAIVSILGVLKADCTYVPLDVSSPPARLAKMLASCEARCVLAAGDVASLLEESLRREGALASIPVGWMERRPPARSKLRGDFSAADLEGHSSEPPDYRNTPLDAAYILFTSGSTGVPKGVVITHSNVAHFVEWATTYFTIGTADRISSHPPLHFDLSVFDLFGTLAAGAELHLVPPELNLQAKRLAEFIRDEELTQWFSVPSVLTLMARFDVVRFDDFPALKRLLWCGEVLPTPILMHWMRRLPHVSFTNLYGPTEATIASSHHAVTRLPEDESAPIPIGKACDGEELLVLDDLLEQVPAGATGDLYIRGVGLSPGYWRDPAATCAAFLPYPHSGVANDRVYKTGDLAKVGDDGLLYFLGRTDSQIKSRGYRVELAEIEAALSTVWYLTESAVVAIPTGGFEGSVICCAYVAAPSAHVSPALLRKDLGRMVPNHMVPSHWLALDSLPKNSSWKVDRPKLRECFQAVAARAYG